MNIIGPKIRAIREAKSMTQGQLAGKCRGMGWNISRGTLAKIEAQVRRVTDEEVVRLSKALDADIQLLFK